MNNTVYWCKFLVNENRKLVYGHDTSKDATAQWPQDFAIKVEFYFQLLIRTGRNAKTTHLLDYVANRASSSIYYKYLAGNCCSCSTYWAKQPLEDRMIHVPETIWYEIFLKLKVYAGLRYGLFSLSYPLSSLQESSRSITDFLFIARQYHSQIDKVNTLDRWIILIGINTLVWPCQIVC